MVQLSPNRGLALVLGALRPVRRPSSEDCRRGTWRLSKAARRDSGPERDFSEREDARCRNHFL